MPPIPTQPTGDLFAWHRALREANSRDPARPRVLSRQALALAFVIGTFMDGDASTPPRFAPGLSKLSKALGYPDSDHRRAVGKLLRELETAGYLAVIVRKGHGRPSLYTGTVPLNVAAEARADGEEPEGGACSEAVVPAADDEGSGVPPAPKKPGSSAASTPQKTGTSAVPDDQICGQDAARPSPSFLIPSLQQHREHAAGSPVSPAHPPEEARPAKGALRQALNQLPRPQAEALLASLAALEIRVWVGRQIDALCALGAEAKVVQELARPYQGARNPAAVAAKRINDLHAQYGYPAGHKP